MNAMQKLGYGAVASMLLVASSVSAGDDLNWRNFDVNIRGSWEVETTVRLPADDCTTAPLVPPFAPNPFPAFNTFHMGGTMTEQGSRSSPANRSTGFGVWERSGSRTYAYRLLFHSFDGNGLLSAIMDITSDVKLAKDGQTFEGVSRLVRTDTSGNALHFCATLIGERIVL